MDENQFIRGFNNGYVLKEHKPALFDKLVKGISGDSPYLEGLKEGALQRDNEIMREKIKKSMQKDQKKERGKGRDR